MHALHVSVETAGVLGDGLGNVDPASWLDTVPASPDPWSEVGVRWFMLLVSSTCCVH